MDFPDPRSALAELIEGTDHDGQNVPVVFHQSVDERGNPALPQALIYQVGGTEGYIDRVDEVAIEVYAEGNTALRILNSIKSAITGDSIETAAGYLDEVAVKVIPVEVPYPSDTVAMARAVFEVISRPL